MNCDILAASFKNSNQVLRLIENGVGSVTAAPSVIDNLFMIKMHLNLQKIIKIFQWELNI